MLRPELIVYAALDAYASALVSEAVRDLLRVHRYPKREDLKESTPVRLLPERGSEPVGYARVLSAEEKVEYVRGANGKRHSKKYFDVRIKLEHISRPAVLIPHPLPELHPEPRSLQDVPIEEELSWSRNCMQLSTEAELSQMAEKQCQKEAHESDAQALMEAAQSEAEESEAATSLEAQESEAPSSEVQEPEARDDIDDVVVPNWMFPDGTTIQDYPDCHLIDPPNDDDNNDNDDIIVLEHQEDGSVRVANVDVPSMERNGVKGDAFHLFSGMKKVLKKKHGIFKTFSGLYRDAVFMADPEAMELERKKLSDELFANPKSDCHNDREKADTEATRRFNIPGNKLLDSIPRHIPPPDVLLPRIQKVVEVCANVKDNKTGELFFSKAAWKVYYCAWTHLKKGCYSDKPGFNYYYFITTKSGNKKLMCVRGTSALEGFHMHLRKLFPGFHTAPLLATCLLALFVYRWNMDRAVERGLISEDYAGWYEHDIVLDLQNLSCSLKYVERLCDNFESINDYVDTRETFFTPMKREIELLQAQGNGLDEGLYSEDDELPVLSASMAFEAQRDQAQHHLPFSPVNSFERAMVKSHLAKFQRQSGSSNQHGSVDFDAAVVAWNSMCDDEQLKPLQDRKKMFPKIAFHFKTFYNEEKRKENQRRTERQVVSVTNERGVRHAVVASRQIERIREEMQEQNSEAVFQEPLPQAAPIQAPTNVAKGSKDAIAVPPVELLAARQNPRVMSVIEAGHHLNPPVLPAPAAAVPQVNLLPPRKMRCLRCGFNKAGPHHQRRAAINSEAYCQVPANHRFLGWLIPEGYQVNDQRKKADAKTVKRRWRQHRLDNDIEEHPDFKNWEQT